LKEQILHLDPHDDYISTRDKMGWVQTERVLLVWPARGRVLTRYFDLLLLHRHAHQLGAHLGLVTRDAEVREHAGALGLPVFESVETSRRMRWRSRLPRLRPERTRPRPDPQGLRRAASPARFRALPAWVAHSLRGLAFALGLSALLALAYTLIPAATVTLTPATQPIRASVEVIADPDLNGVYAPNLIPARTARAEVEDAGFVVTTGSRDVPSDKATGKAVFTNIVGLAATLPQGTSVRTTTGTPVRFVTTRPANIEARVGAVVEVDIQAADPGPSGNVAAAQINAIDGPLGTQLAVTNPAPTQGGAVERTAAVTALDRQQLRQQLLTQLQQKALGLIEAQLQPGEFLVADSIRVADVMAETFDKAVGEAGDTVNLTLRVAVTGLVVDENDARLVGHAALDGQVPADSALGPQPLEFVRDPAISLDAEGRAHFTLTASGEIVARIDESLARHLAQGRPASDAERYLLAALPLAGPPQIEIQPAWLARWYNRLPWMQFRIDVVVLP
jgi:hypothetical protein